MKVLIVEDERITRDQLALLLKEWGYEVLTAADGNEALEIFKNEPVRLVLTDILMPGIDGIDLCKRIRGIRRENYTYILVITGMSDQKSLFDAMFAGADDFIVKPWHNSEVRARLRTGERIIHLEDELKERIKKLEEANQIIRHANERMVREVTFMSRMHSTMLPPENMQFPGLRCVWKHQPHSMTAGDGMNFFRLDEKHFAVVMVDVSNSGDAASFLLGALARRLVPIPGQPGILKMLSRQAPGYEIMDPKKVVGLLSQEFPLDLDSGKSFSIFYGVFDVADSSLTYASAGFTQPLLLKRNGKIIETEPGEPAIGSKIGGNASQFKISLESGDRFLAFSPGLSQLRDASGEPFGSRRLIELLKRRYSAGLEDLTEEFFRAAMGWNPETTADVSLILVEYSGDSNHGA